MAEIELNGLKFHYQITGEGQEWLIYLHGLVMDNLSSGYFTLAQSLKAYRLCLYDLRGHGLSSRPKTNYRIEDHVSDLYALIQNLILKNTISPPKLHSLALVLGA
jgi:pimeloyl-ACP methyl ester carboxylesterase